jgi:ABC-type uncharacterized transport system permease subunit
MNTRYLIMILAGLVLTVWGFPAAYRLSRPWHLLAALAGILGILFGTLLLVVPGFLTR